MVNWEEVEKQIKQSGKYPPFLTLPGKSGSKEFLIGYKVIELNTKFGKRFGIYAVDEEGAKMFLIPISILREQLETFRHLDERHRVARIKIAWLGTGKGRRYELLDLEVLNDDDSYQKFADAIRPYVEREKESQEEEQEEQEEVVKTPENFLLKMIRNMLQFTDKLPYPNTETLVAWTGFKEEYAKKEFEKIKDRLKIKKIKGKKYIVGVE